MTEHTGSSTLFAVFALSIYTLILLPYTIYSFCNGSDDQVVQPYLQKKQQKSGLSKLLRKLCSKRNLIILALWIGWVLLLWYVQVTSKDMKPFDPFEILQIERGATEKEIKKAYRQLSLKFHPDKNPDPKAHKYFAESITKAYEALTDDVARKNWEQHGHPDGPQAMNVGVALPEWFFTKDSKLAPLMLLGLVGCGILLPLGVISWYMLSSNRYSGPNGVMQETLMFYYHSKFSVKESQSLVRIPETLVCAMEFIIMPTPSEQTQALEEVRRLVLRAYPDLKDKAAFWKRKASVLKAHMLLLLHLERLDDEVPAILQADLKFVLGKCPVLLEEMMKIAVLPRPPLGYGWLTPAQAIVEMSQCLSQGLSISARRPSGAKPGFEALAALLQLPHFDSEVTKKLKRRKVNTIKDLLDLPETERREALASASLKPEQADEALLFAQTLPAVHARVDCEVDGEEEIMEGDLAKCRVRLLLTRPLHNRPDFDLGAAAKAGGGKVRAFTPNFPLPKDENWHLILADTAANSVLAWTTASLAEAEAHGFDRPDAVEEWEKGNTGSAAGAGGNADGAAGDKGAADKDGDRSKSRALATANKFINRYGNGNMRNGGSGAAGGEGDIGQTVELTFMAPRAGKHELQLYVMCDSYVGADRVLPVRLRVVPLTRAVQEGRDAKSVAKAKEWASDDEDDEDAKEARDAESAADSDDEGSGDDDDIGSDEYDSEEDGEEETDDEEEEAGEGEDKDSKPVPDAKDKAAKSKAAAAVAATAAAVAAAGGKKADEGKKAAVEVEEEDEDEEEDGDE